MKTIFNVVSVVILVSVLAQANAQQVEPTTIPMMQTKYGHVYVNAQLNGIRNQPMILDTAATVGVIPNNVLEELELPAITIDKEEVHGAGGKVTLSKTKLMTTRIDNISVNNLPYVIQDMKVLELDSGKIPGILGYGFLSKQCSIFDFTNEQVTFHSNTCPQQTSLGLNSADFWLEDDLIKLNIEFNGVKVEAVLDTGAPVNIINSALLAKLDTEKLERNILKGLHSKGVSHQRLGKVTYTVGKKTIVSSNTIASDMPVFTKLGYEDKPVFLMGLADFSKSKLVIDYQAKKIYF